VLGTAEPEACSGNVLAGLLKLVGEALLLGDSAVGRAQHPSGMGESGAKPSLVFPA